MEPNLAYFEYAHLPVDLQSVSRMFHTLAHGLDAVLPKNVERGVTLRKLLEAKDAAVRSFLERSK